MVNIVSTFLNTTFQTHLVGFFEPSDFFSFRATCRSFTKLGRNDTNVNHRGVAFTDYTLSLKNLDVQIGTKYQRHIEARDFSKDLMDEDSYRDCELSKIKFVKTITYSLLELSFVSKDFHSPPVLYQDEFLKYAHYATFANLQIFHYTMPNRRKIGSKQSHKGIKSIYEPFYIKPTDIRQLAKRCQNIHTLYISLFQTDDPAYLTNFLRPIDPESEGDQKVYAETCFPNLTHLSLNCSEKTYSKELISILNKFPALKTISVHSGYSPVFFEVFSNVPKFTDFRAYYCSADIISKLTSIQKLNIVGCNKFDLEDYDKIFSLPSLTSLTVGNNSFETIGILPIHFIEVMHRKATNLRELNFICWRHTDKFDGVFSVCSKMKNLQKIGVIQTYINNENLYELSKCNLVEIHLSDLETWDPGAISDKGLLTLKSKTLQKLTLCEKCFSTQAILELISGCPNLTSVDISELTQQNKDEVIKAFGSKINIETLKR